MNTYRLPHVCRWCVYITLVSMASPWQIHTHKLTQTHTGVQLVWHFPTGCCSKTKSTAFPPVQGRPFLIRSSRQCDTWSVCLLRGASGVAVCVRGDGIVQQLQLAGKESVCLTLSVSLLTEAHAAYTYSAPVGACQRRTRTTMLCLQLQRGL